MRDAPLVQRVPVSNAEQVKQKIDSYVRTYWNYWSSGQTRLDTVGSEKMESYVITGKAAPEWWKNVLPKLVTPDQPEAGSCFEVGIPDGYQARDLTKLELFLLHCIDYPKDIRSEECVLPKEVLTLFDDVVKAEDELRDLETELREVHNVAPPKKYLCLTSQGDKPPDEYFENFDAAKEVVSDMLIILQVDKKGSTLERGWELAIVDKVHHSTQTLDLTFVRPVMDIDDTQHYKIQQTKQWPVDWHKQRLLLWKVPALSAEDMEYGETEAEGTTMQPVGDDEGEYPATIASRRGSGRASKPKIIQYRVTHVAMSEVVWGTHLRAKKRGLQLGKLGKQQRNIIHTAALLIEEHLKRHPDEGTLPLVMKAATTTPDDDGQEE
jgi:hypothetical protein